MRASILSCLVASLLLVPASRAEELPDVCSLLPAAEIEAIQGEPVAATKGSAPERAAFAVSQCFYTLPTFTRSISLELTMRSAKDEVGPREHWRRVFHGPREAPQSSTRASGREAAVDADAPRPVGGVGDEAFWTGNSLVGALYVLKGDAYLRISIGGAEDASIRIKKTKRLAKVALKQLHSSDKGVAS